MTFLLFTSVAFALKVGSDFSRGAVLLFGVVDLIAILLHRALWRIIIEHALEVGALRGRRSILLYMYESPPVADVIRNVTRDFVRSGYEIIQFLHFGNDIPQKRVIDHMIEVARGYDIEEIFFAADVQRWSEISHVAQELCVIPLPHHGLTRSLITTITRNSSVSMRSGITSNRELQGGPRSEVTGAKLPPCAP
jgi:hypothetical protein